jgi:hypothetical protein
MDEKTYIMGNPPFIGAHLQTEFQKRQTQRIWNDVKNAGSLDYVANWFRIASSFSVSTGARAAFVASKSITQGEHPPIMWRRLSEIGISIDFAHQSFRWQNGGREEAGVFVVIIGFSANDDSQPKILWTRSPEGDELIRVDATNINAYLLNAQDVFVTARSKPIVQSIPRLRYGSKPTDGGFISNISSEEADEMRNRDPIASRYLRKVVGARELLYNEERYCLWLVNASQSDLSQSSEISRRLSLVRSYRLKSKKAATRELALSPHLFEFNSHSDSDYMALPLHSSSERDYIPFAYLSKEVIATNALSVISDAPLWLFGAMSSRCFVLWTHAISGRLGESPRISGTITYNNFPFPPLEDGLRDELEDGAKLVLEARDASVGSSLADLYEGVVMPLDLRRAHLLLDRAMAGAFGVDSGAPDDAVLEAIFHRYQELA